MDKIASFTVDHTNLKKGMYTSRVDFGDIVSYDIRMKEPNKGDYLSTGAGHTLEHLFATYARNSRWADTIIYVGPMGCRTGCYLVVKGLPSESAIQLVQEAMRFIADFSGEIPGNKAEECGNYQDHDMPAARQVAAEMVSVLLGWTPNMLDYAFHT